MDPVKSADKKRKKRLTMSDIWNDFDGAEILASLQQSKRTLSNFPSNSLPAVYGVGKPSTWSR
jgi:hypothetical protein